MATLPVRRKVVRRRLVKTPKPKARSQGFLSDPKIAVYGAFSIMLTVVFVGIAFGVVTRDMEGLKGFWKFEDSGSNEVAGRSVSTATGATFGEGRIGKGLVLNGKSGFGRVTDDPSQNLTQITVSAWFYLEGFSETNRSTIASSYTPANTHGYWLAVEDGRLRFWVGSEKAKGDVHSLVVVPGQKWVHAVATYDKTHLRIYQDGKEVARVMYEDGMDTRNSDDLVIGRSSLRLTEGDFLHGTIDELAIFDRALTPEEVEKASATPDKN